MSNEKTYQIIVLGYSSIGHGALINRYVNNICEPGEVGREFWKKNILVDGHYEFFQIYDLICTYCRFGFSINYNEFQGIIIIFDVPDRFSFLNVENYFNDIRINSKNNVEVILVGDRGESNREISKEEATKYAFDHSIHYFDILIRDNECVNDVFIYIATQILHHLHK